MLKVRFSCSRCGTEKDIDLQLDENGFYSIPSMYCPKDLYRLDREVMLHTVDDSNIIDAVFEDDGVDTSTEEQAESVKIPVRPTSNGDESEDKAGTADSVSD